MTTAPISAPADRRSVLAAFRLFVAVAIALLTWAKWWPYSVKIPKAAETHALGTSIITGENSAPPGFSLTAGIDFARAYFLSIWPALVAGLFIGAAVTVLVPRIWVVRALAGHGRASTLRGGLLSVPTMMCTCCTAPVAVGLRKRGASVGASVAFWLGNPALNPAVLAFSFFVLGWQWTVLRAAAGVLLVLGVVPSRVPARASLGQRSPSRLRRPARWLPVSFGPSAAWRCVCCRSTCCWSSPSARCAGRCSPAASDCALGYSRC